MRQASSTTPLLELLRALETDERRDEFAGLAGTTRSYLYQLATCQRSSPRAVLAKGIADASVEMGRQYGTPVITLDQVASMCAACKK